jgi:hypothetical protein
MLSHLQKLKKPVAKKIIVLRGQKVAQLKSKEHLCSLLKARRNISYFNFLDSDQKISFLFLLQTLSKKSVLCCLKSPPSKFQPSIQSILARSQTSSKRNRVSIFHWGSNISKFNAPL